jgi:hypothetical protein
MHIAVQILLLLTAASELHHFLHHPHIGGTCDEPSLDIVVTKSHMDGGSMCLALNAHSLKR